MVKRILVFFLGVVAIVAMPFTLAGCERDRPYEFRYNGTWFCNRTIEIFLTQEGRDMYEAGELHRR